MTSTKRPRRQEVDYHGKKMGDHVTVYDVLSHDEDAARGTLQTIFRRKFSGTLRAKSSVT
jgi:hypothetical protein